MKKLVAGYDMGKAFCERHGFNGKRALDIGAGHCAHTVGFAEYFDYIDALDRTDVRFDREALKELSPSHDKVHFLKMDSKEIDKLEPYDLVYSLSAMEHFDDWRQVMQKIPGITKKWFYLVISPLYYSPLGHHLDPEIGEWEHLLLTEDELYDKVKSLGMPGWRWEVYKELNKVTAPELITEARKNFDITYLKHSITTIEMVCQKR